ncbi:hypothetical protein [Kushneria pakistanensis]|nr:hypothetical protein [Kushneria pakistanensis]
MAAAILSGCGDDRPEWMQDAWEHDVDQKRWQESRDYMKVATAGLWLERLQEEDKLSLDKPVEDMEPEAKQLAACIDGALKHSKVSLRSDGVSHYAAMCVSLLGYGA